MDDLPYLLEMAFHAVLAVVTILILNAYCLGADSWTVFCP